MSTMSMTDTEEDSNESLTVRVKQNTWKELNQRKQPGDSFDDVIQRLLKQSDDE